MVYFRVWILIVRILFRYCFSGNRTNKYYLAGKHILSLSFRYPEKNKQSFVAFLKVFVKSLLLTRISNDKAISVYSRGGTFFYETANEGNNEIIRLSHLQYYTRQPVNGAIWKNNLLGFFTIPDKIFQLFFESLLFIGLLPLCFFAPYIGSLGLIFFEYVELANLLKTVKKYHIRTLYYYSIYEKDSNLTSVALQKLGIKVIKVTSLTPLKFWNYVMVATDTLALCDVNQFEELKMFTDTIQVKKVELWGPENIAQIVPHYESLNANDTNKLTIGFYSTASYIRELEGNIEQYVGKNALIVKSYLAEYLRAHPDIKLLIFPHPREKSPKYRDLMEKHYEEYFAGINYTIWDSPLPSASCFEKADLGVALYSSVMYERIYFGFKCLMMPFSKEGLQLPGQGIQNICAENKVDFFAKIDLFLNLSSEEYFRKTGLKKSSYLLAHEAKLVAKEENLVFARNNTTHDKSKIAIVNYGLGNPASIQNMIRRLGYNSVISSDPGEILAADKLILPGVGAFAKGMENLRESGLLEILNQKVLVNKTPVLGICLGMELMTSHSEEGNADGLNWIPAQTKKFVFKNIKLPIPHMGWTDVDIGNHWLFRNANSVPRYYFAHSYYVSKDTPYSIATAKYGFPFTCAIARENIVGVQFHPEKSHRFGLSILYNFISNG